MPWGKDPLAWACQQAAEALRKPWFLLLVGHVRLQGRAERTPPEWCMSSRLQLSRIKWSRDALGALSSLCIRPEGCRHWTLPLARHAQPEGEYPMIAQQFGEEEQRQRDACKPYSQPGPDSIDSRVSRTVRRYLEPLLLLARAASASPIDVVDSIRNILLFAPPSDIYACSPFHMYVKADKEIVSLKIVDALLRGCVHRSHGVLDCMSHNVTKKGSRSCPKDPPISSASLWAYARWEAESVRGASMPGCSQTVFQRIRKGLLLVAPVRRPQRTITFFVRSFRTRDHDAAKKKKGTGI